MGLLKAFLNLNNAEGIREAMRNSYKANRRQAERGRIATDFSPHIVGLAGAMEVRMRVSGLDPSPTDLWYEIVPFALIADPEVGVEAIAEYAVEVAPIWWTPNLLRRERSPQCQERDHRMRRSSGVK